MEEEDRGGVGIDRRAEHFRQIFSGGPPQKAVPTEDRPSSVTTANKTKAAGAPTFQVLL